MPRSLLRASESRKHRAERRADLSTGGQRRIQRNHENKLIFKRQSGHRVRREARRYWMQPRTIHLRFFLQEGKGVCPPVSQGVDELSKSSLATSTFPTPGNSRLFHSIFHLLKEFTKPLKTWPSMNWREATSKGHCKVEMANAGTVLDTKALNAYKIWNVRKTQPSLAWKC